MGLRARSGRRTDRAHARLGADRRRRLRGLHHALDGRVRGVAFRWRHGGRELQLGRWPVGLRMVPARAARVGYGRPPRLPSRSELRWARWLFPKWPPSARSATSALVFPALLCAASAVLSVVAITDPPRKEWDDATDEELANPYRRSWVLRRIHAVSALLMVPQTVTVTFMLIWLIANYRCSIALAGALVTVSQLLGAVGRVLVGRWSDRVGSRLRPVRIMSVVGVLVMVGLAFADHLRCIDCGAVDGRGVGRRRARQRVGVHGDHRIRRTVLEWARAGPAEHLSATDGGRRAAGVRCADRRARLSAGVRRVRAVPASGGAHRAGQDVAARPGD